MLSIRRPYLAVVVVASMFLHAQDRSDSEIELVESIPVGTVLDNPNIRNTQEVWLEMIRHSKQTLNFEEFYISNEPGKLLEPVLAEIFTAAKRGVIVRLIADSKMYKTYPETLDSLRRTKNIDVHIINFGAVAGGIQHSKYFIVDGQEVFVGSQNFDWRSLEHIHELGFRINNKEIAEIYGDIFDLDWELSFDSGMPASEIAPSHKSFSLPIRLRTADGTEAVIVPTCSPVGFIPDSTLWDETAILRVINEARSTLSLQFLSYSTSIWGQKGSYTIINDALQRAAKRGVHVRLIVSDWEMGTSAEKGLKELSALPNIEVSFTSIPEWSGGYISYARVEHCKYIVADDTSFWLGTANCEKSYFYTTRNLGITGTSHYLASTLTRIFDKSWNSPYKVPVSPDGSYPRREHGEKK